MDGHAQRHDFVRIQVDRGEAPEHGGDEPAHDGHARRAAGQHHSVEFAAAQVRIAERALHRGAQTLEQRLAGLFERKFVELEAMLGVAVADAHRRLWLHAQRPLGGFGLRRQALHEPHVLAQAIGKLDAAEEELREGIADIFSSEEVVAGGRSNFHHAVVQLQDRDVECASAEVEHEELGFLVALMDTIG